jgi:hypothetical protein
MCDGPAFPPCFARERGINRSAKPLPQNPDDLTAEGYKDISHPDAAAAGHKHTKIQLLEIWFGLTKEKLGRRAMKAWITIIGTTRKRKIEA